MVGRLPDRDGGLVTVTGTRGRMRGGRGSGSEGKNISDLAARGRDFLLATVMKPSSSTSAELETEAA